MKQGKPVIFPTGWTEHHIQVAFVGDYMLICNRGDQRQPASIKPYKIDRSKLTMQDVHKMRNKEFTGEEGGKYFYQDLPASLGSQSDLICKMIEENCKQSDQKMGNCWWASPKSAILGLVTIQNLLKANFIPMRTKKKLLPTLSTPLNRFINIILSLRAFKSLNNTWKDHPIRPGATMLL